jgi:hypothetical protein
VNNHNREARPAAEERSEPKAERSSIGLLNMRSMLVGAVLLGLFAIYAYVNNWPLQGPEYAFLLAAFYVLVHGARWVARQVRRSGAGKP